MPFNPDEYLKESNSFNPDEYLSETPTTTSALSAGAKSAVSGTLPAVGGMLGAAGLLGGITLATGGVGTLPALGLMLAGGMGGSYIAGKAQEHLIEPNIPEDFKASMGFDPTLRAKETQEHPYASFAGQLAPNLAFFRPGKLADITLDSGKVLGSGTQRAMGAAIGGGIDAGTQLYDKGTIDPTQLAMSMAFQAVAAKPTALGKMLMPGHEAMAPKDKEPSIFKGTEPEAIQHASDTKMSAIRQIESAKQHINSLERERAAYELDSPDDIRIREEILETKDYQNRQTTLRDKMDAFLEGKLPPEQRRAAQPIDKEALLKEYTELGQKRHAPSDLKGMTQTIDRQTEIAEILKKHAEATKEAPVASKAVFEDAPVGDAVPQSKQTSVREDTQRDAGSSPSESEILQNLADSPNTFMLMEHQRYFKKYVDEFGTQLDKDNLAKALETTHNKIKVSQKEIPPPQKPILIAHKKLIYKISKMSYEELVHFIEQQESYKGSTRGDDPVTLIKRAEARMAREELAKRFPESLAKEEIETPKVDPIYSVNPDGVVDKGQTLATQLQGQIEHNNLRGAIRNIIEHPTTSKPLRAIARLIESNKLIGKYSKIYYDAGLHAIDKFGRDVPVEMGVNADTVDIRVRTPGSVGAVGVIHEVLHVATSGMFHAFGRDKYMPNHIKRAILNIQDLHTDLKGAHYNNVVRQIMDKFPMTPDQLAMQAKDSKKTHEYFAMEMADVYLSNPKELVAYGLTDSVFRPILNNIEVGGVSARTTFLNELAAMFQWGGKEKRTALEALTANTETLLAESSGQVYENSQGQRFPVAAGVDPIYGFRDNKGDIGYEATNRYVNAIANMGIHAAKRMLSPAAFAKFWPEQALIGHVAKITADADRSQEFRRARLLGGTNDIAVLKGMPLFRKMSKQINDDGLLGAMASITDKQMGEMMPDLIAMSRDGVTINPSAHPTWTPHQKNMAQVIVDTHKQMLAWANESLKVRGLKPITEKEGYLPHMQIGDFSADLHLNGEMVRQEWFISKVEAEHHVDMINKANGDFKALVGEREPGADYAVIAEKLQETLDKHALTGIPVKDLIAAQIDTLTSRASNVGAHQKHSAYMRGFMGDESVYGVTKNGARYKKALEMWVQEYTEALRRREVATDSAEYMTSVESQQTRIDQPNAFKVARYFLDKQLGILKSPYKGEVSRMTNAIVNDAFARMFPGVKLTDHVISHVWNQMSRAGYNMVLTSSPAVWITQALGFIQMGRGMVKEGSINPLTIASSASKGLFKVMFNQYSPDMLEGLLHVAQNTDTFDKHMTNEVISFVAHQDKAHITNRMREWLSGEKFTTMGDSFSRVVAWAMAYEHMTASGLKGKEAWMKAADMTDDNLIRFGKKNLPGMYDELGAVGSLISPLKNYISGQVSNIAVDVKGITQGVVRNVKNRTLGDRALLRDTMALTMNALGMMMLGGLISTPIMQDYEYLRQQLVKWGVIQYDSLPDWTKFSASFGDVAHRGAIAITGIDMGASMRYQSLLKSGVDTTSNGISGISMPLSVTAKALSGAATVTKNFVGGGVPDAQFDEAVKGIVPRGIPSGIADTIINSNREKETRGQRGNALTDSGPTEKIARFLGSKSVEQANQTEALNVLDLKNKSMIPIKQKMVDLILSEGAGDRERGLDMARKFIAKREMTPDDLKTMLLNQALAKKKDALLSKFTNKQGQMTTPSQVRNLKEIKDMLYNK